MFSKSLSRGKVTSYKANVIENNLKSTLSDFADVL